MLFSRWLGRQAVRLRRVSSEHPAQYLRSRARRVQVHKGDAAALRQLIDFLRRHGVIPAEEIAPRRLSPVDQTVQAFVRDERALVVAAIERRSKKYTVAIGRDIVLRTRVPRADGRNVELRLVPQP